MAGEKTEKPSKRKLSKARERGQIFKSKDIIDTISILATLYLLKLFTPFILDQYHKYLRSLYNPDLFEVSQQNLYKTFFKATIFLLVITVPILLIILLVNIVGNYAQVGFLISKEGIKFDLKRIDPVSGFKRMFSKKSLLEVCKFLLKFTIIVIIVGNDIKKDFIGINNLIYHNLRTSTSLMFTKLFSISIKIVLILFVLSFVDYFLQRRFYMNDMKMTKQEVKDEYKESEGDPLLKGKLKERQREIATSTLVKAAQEATVVVVNPTHIAICIKYELGMPAPITTAIARDNIALKLKEIAKENNIPIVENIPLARALYNDAEVDQPIPSKYFRAIAELLVSIMNSSR